MKTESTTDPIPPAFDPVGDAQRRFTQVLCRAIIEKLDLEDMERRKMGELHDVILGAIKQYDAYREAEMRHWQKLAMDAVNSTVRPVVIPK